MMIKLELLINPDKDIKKTCICNYNNPSCDKGYRGECERLNVLYDPYSDIEGCMKHDSYKRVGRRLRQR